MDFYVCLERPGYRVARRRQQQSRVGFPHRLTQQDSIQWFTEKYDGVVTTKKAEAE